jgi:hypothetical protein
MLLGDFGLQDSIYRSYHLLHAFLGFGILGLLQSARCFLSRFFKIECGRRIDFRKEGGKIAAYANFATKCKSRPLISFFIAGPLSEFDPSWRFGIHDLEPSDWNDIHSIKDWWVAIIHQRGGTRKAMATLAMLVPWEIWKEGNVWIFCNHYTTSTMIKRRRLYDALLGQMLWVM